MSETLLSPESLEELYLNSTGVTGKGRADGEEGRGRNCAVQTATR